MWSKIVSFCSLFLIGGALVFGAHTHRGPPVEKLNNTSLASQIKLTRAEHTLATLVPNPQDYNLLLSNQPSFGAIAVPPHVYSDKPTIIVYQGAISPDRSNEELAFVLAHELSHLQLKHNEGMEMQMGKLFNGPPLGLSGMTFSIFHQKLEERAADVHGLYLYKKAGYDLNFFPYTFHLIQINPNIHYGTTHMFLKERSSLSYHDAHFNMKERFELLSRLAKS